jgi:hypothetical protein
MDALRRSLILAEIRAFLKTLTEKHGVDPFANQEGNLEDLSDDDLMDVERRLRDMLRTLGGVR